jgi:hypothetical protein
MSLFNGHVLITALAPTGALVTIGGYGTAFTDSAPVQHISRLTEHIGAMAARRRQWDDTHYEMSLTFRPAKRLR